MVASGQQGMPRWRPPSKKLLPSSKVAAMSVILVLVLGLLELEGGFLRELHSNVKVVVLEEGAASSPPFADDQLRSPDLPNCLAKTQHLLYRKESLQFPTPAHLQSVLDEYDAMHRRCTVGKDWDREIVGNNSSSHLNSGPSDVAAEMDPASESCRYLFLQMDPNSGLGNRLLGIVSGFLYALLTNRAIVVDPKEAIWHILCEPFQGSSWFLPDTFPIQTMASEEAVELKDESTQNFAKEVVMVSVRLKHLLGASEKRFWCGGTQEELKEVKWVVWRTNQHLIPRFYSTPFFWPHLRALFPPDLQDPSRLFLHLSRHLILPRNHLWDRILRVYWSQLADAKKRVGVQIRRHNSGKGFSLEVQERMMKCLVEQLVLPNTTAYPIDEPAAISLVGVSQNVQLLSNQLRKLRLQAADATRWQRHFRSLGSSYSWKQDERVHEQQEQSRPIVVLLASLRLEYWEETQKQYTNYPTEDGSMVRVVQVTHDSFQRQSFSQMSDALVEMWLLSFCDVLVISTLSTFGYIPVGLSGLTDSYVLNIKDEKLKPEAEACLKWHTSDPCNHCPFLDNACTQDKHGSSQEPEMDQEQLSWVQQHIVQCETRTGIQILPD